MFGGGQRGTWRLDHRNGDAAMNDRGQRVTNESRRCVGSGERPCDRWGGGWQEELSLSKGDGAFARTVMESIRESRGIRFGIESSATKRRSSAAVLRGLTG